jgi:hypothetical protein
MHLGDLVAVYRAERLDAMVERANTRLQEQEEGVVAVTSSASRMMS